MTGQAYVCEVAPSRGSVFDGQDEAPKAGVLWLANEHVQKQRQAAQEEVSANDQMNRWIAQLAEALDGKNGGRE